MRLFPFAVCVLVLPGLGVAIGQNQVPQPVSQPNPPQPVPIQPGLPQPNPPMVIFPGNTGMISRLEEEVETLEAQRDTKKAIVKAAEVGVRAATVGLERVSRIAASGASSKEDVDRAKLEVEAAQAQLDIRLAEMKEIEVKIKYAKKRLDEAKAGPRPFNPPVPPNPPRPVEPPKKIDPSGQLLVVASASATSCRV
jgi:hypothetical protein